MFEQFNFNDSNMERKLNNKHNQLQERINVNIGSKGAKYSG